jgi:large subunit ribosomal protein L32e
MASVKELLELRKQIKSKKPDFIRQDAHKKRRLGAKWRKPKGLHSKIRLHLKGRAKKVSKGYRSPKKVRHMHKSGLQQTMIKSIGDLEGLDVKKNCLIISSSLGNKKKIAILKKIKELGFNILNVRNPDEYIKNVEDKIISRKKAKKEEKGKAKVKETEKKGEKLTQKVNDQDKKEVEKKEKDKILTKKDK